MAKNFYHYGLVLALCGNNIWADEISANHSPSPITPLAVVNDVAITAQDIQFATGPGRTGHGHNGAADPSSKATEGLEAVVQQEILAQQAVALGLNNDPGYREWNEKLEMQLRAFQRKRLADLLLEREIANQSKVTDEEAKAWFNQRAEQIGSEVRVLQILRREETSLLQALEDIKQGVPFSEVAARGLPELSPDAVKPWDLGYLHWEQIPSYWWEALASLKPGETSGIIRGPGQRYWIIQLLDRRERPGASYDEMKQKISERLQAERAQQLRAELPATLRSQAKVEYPAPVASQ